MPQPGKTVFLESTHRVSNFRFVLNCVLEHKWSYATAILFIFITNWLVVSIPFHIGKSIDLLSGALSENQNELYKHIYLIIAFAVAMVVVRTISRIFFFTPARAIERDVKNAAFKKLAQLQKQFYEKFETGKLISIVNNDINGLRALAGIMMLQFFNIIFALSLTPVQMWRMSPELTLYCFLPVIITFMVAYKATDYLRRETRKRMVELQSLSSSTVAYLNGVDVIKSSHVEPWAVRSFCGFSETLLNRSLGLTKIRTLIMPIIDYTDRFMKVLILAVGGTFLLRQELSLGELTAFLSYSAILARPFISLGRIFSGYQLGMASVESLRRILDQEIEPHELSHLPPDERNQLFSSGIEIKNLNYTYPGSKQPSLSNISFEVRPGQKIGILGQIGSGKTTLVNCLNRYLQIKPGHIFIDGRDITDITRADLRSAVRTITQEPFLFSDTVAENIYFGARSQSDQLPLQEALYQSDMANEVAQFPEQTDTLVGEKGILLSGGQKQRLSLARAIFTPCKLIILDNVLSAVDNETERFLLHQIFKNMRSQSTLIVSHRASVLEKVDHILVLEKGRIIAQGSHTQLMQTSSLYRKTWELQQESGAEVLE